MISSIDFILWIYFGATLPVISNLKNKDNLGFKTILQNYASQSTLNKNAGVTQCGAQRLTEVILLVWSELAYLCEQWNI